MNPTDSSLNAITEYVTDIVWVSKLIETIKYILRRILAQAVSYSCSYNSRYIVDLRMS